MTRGGYASRTPTDQPGRVAFARTLDKRTRWTVNVGCGGTPAKWQYPANGSSLTDLPYQDWTCGARAGPDWTCELAETSASSGIAQEVP